MPDPGVTVPPVHRREALARAWTISATSSSYIPRAADELEAVLLELVDVLLAALAADRFSPSVGREVGTRLVAEGMNDPAALAGTLTVLSEGLLRDVEHNPDTALARRTVSLLGELSAGYADGMRDHTLTQQEGVKQALFNAVLRAQHDLRSTENRFREVFTTSAIGIAITDLDGMCVEANPALGAILGTEPEQLLGRPLRAVFLDDAVVMAGFRQMLDDDIPRVHERHRLRKENGDIAWALLATSLLRDGAGDPVYFVTMVQDVTELQLLQDRLGHQLLHDALTGLPNRQCFHTKLESTLERAEPTATVTLCCLNLDGFSIVNNSRGHSVGDRLLQAVARRLERAMADENALVARIGGDEFAVLVEDGPTTPDIGHLVACLTGELDDPEYLDGHGVAVGASVGVVRRRAGDATAVELFRAADTALRKAKATGRRQWAGFHESDDSKAAELDRWAAELPEAWENGELTVTFEPVVRLPDREPVAARAVLSSPWLDNETCLGLAERTGLAVQLGPHILRAAAAELPTLLTTHGSGNGLLRVHLTRNQSGDADLVRAVHGAIKDNGLAPELLEVSLDAGAVLDEFGDARDNLEVLAEIGVWTGLWRVHGGPRELDLVAGGAVHVVTLDGAAGRAGASEVLRAETEHLVRSVVALGAECSVLDVWSADEAAWWASIGASTAVLADGT